MSKKDKTKKHSAIIGRQDALQQGVAILESLAAASKSGGEPHLLLVSGTAGMGKTALGRDLISKSTQAPFSSGQFHTLTVNFADAALRHMIDLGRDHDEVQAIFQTIHKAAIRKGWGRQFALFSKTLKHLAEAERRAHEALSTLPEDSDAIPYPGIIRALSASALSKLVRFQLPAIGEVGEEMLEFFLETGLTVGMDGATRIIRKVQALIRAYLDPDYYDHLLHPADRLARALGRGFFLVSKRKPLIIFLDAYETIDVIDPWLRVAIEATDARSLWLISGRNNLARSRQFGDGYFDGYQATFTQNFTHFALPPFNREAISQMHPARTLAGAEITRLLQSTHGIPFALHKAIEGSDSTQIALAMTERILRNITKAEERRAIYALALADGDVPLLQAMLKVNSPVASANATHAASQANTQSFLQRLSRHFAPLNAHKATLGPATTDFLHQSFQSSMLLHEDLTQTMLRNGLATLQARQNAYTNGNAAHQRSLDTQIKVFQNLLATAPQLTIPTATGEEMPSIEAENSATQAIAAGNALAANGEREAAEQAYGNALALENNNASALAGLAALYTQADTLDIAIANYHKALEQDAEHLQALVGVGSLYVDIDCSRDGCRYLEKAVAIDPHYPGLQHKLAEAYTELGRGKKAISAWTKVLRQDSGSLTARRHLSDLFIQRGQHDEARQTLETVMVLAEPHADDHCKLATCYHQLGRAENARHSYRQALLLDTEHEAAQVGLAQLPAKPHTITPVPPQNHNESQNSYSASSWTTVANSSNSNGDIFPPPPELPHPLPKLQPRPAPSVYKRNGKTETTESASGGQFQKDLEAYQDAQTNNQSPNLTPDRMGNVLWSLDKPKDAIEAFAEAEAQNLSPLSMLHRGDALSAQGLWSEALAAYKSALMQADGQTAHFQAALHNGLGTAYSKLQRPEEASAAFLEATLFDEHSAPAFVGLGTALAKIGKHEKAIEAFNTALALDATPSQTHAPLHYQLGRIYWQLGREKEAKKALNRTITLDATLVDAYVLLGDICLKQGDLQVAKTNYQLAARTKTNIADAYRGLGDVHYHTSVGTDEALEAAHGAWQRALALDSNLPAAHIGSGNYHLRHKNFTAAQTAYERALSLGAADVPWRNLGDVRLALGHFGVANSNYQTALEENGQDVQALYGLGRVFMHQNKDDEALKMFENARILSPDNPNILQQIAHIHDRNGAGAQAATLYHTVQSLAPTNGVTADNSRPDADAAEEDDANNLIQVGNLLTEKVDLDNAYAAYSQALTLDPNNIEALIGMGNADFEAGRYQQAIVIFNQAHTLANKLMQPEAIPHAKLGQSYYQTGQYEESMIAYTRAIRRPTADCDDFAGHGHACLAADKQIRAAQSFKRALTLNPSHASAKYGAGLLAESKGEQDDALRLFSEAAKSDPLRHEAYQAQGRVRLDKNEPDAALSAYRKALTLAPTCSESRCGVALAHLQNNNLAGAEAAFKRVIKDDPSHAAAYHGLATIQAQSGDLAGAQTTYAQLADNGAATFESLLSLGNLRLKTKAYEEAEAAFREASALNKLSAEAQLGLAEATRQQGKNQTAYTAYAHAHFLLDDLTEMPFKAFIEICQKLGKKQYVADLYDEIASRYPEDIPFILAHAEAHAALGNTKEAHQILENLPLENDQGARAATIRGLVFEMAGDTQKAKQQFEIATQDNGGSAEAWAGLGAIQRQMGDRVNAAKLFEKALALAPENEKALQGRAEITLQKAAMADSDSAPLLIEKALADYKALIKNGAENAAVFHGMGACYQMQADFEIALTALQKAQALDPQRKGLLYDIGRCHLILNQSEAAVAALRKAVQQQPKDNTVMLHLGRAYLSHEDLGRAFSTLSTLMERPSPSPDAYVAYGQVQMARGQVDSAEQAFRWAYSLNPDTAGVAVGLGDIAKLNKHDDNAAIYYQQALETNPDDIDALTKLGELAVSAEKFDEAVGYFKQALQKNPHHQFALLQLATCYDKQNKTVAVVKMLRRAARLQPLQTPEATTLAENQLKLGAFQAALGSFQSALENEPNNPDLLAGLGDSYRALRYFKESLDAYQRAMRLDRDHYRSAMGHGLLNLAQDDPLPALSQFRRASRLQPHAPAPRIGTAQAQRMLNRPDQAMDTYEQVLTLDPQSAQAYSGMGVVYADGGHPESAAAAFHQAIELDPSSAEAHAGLGDFFARKNRLGEALEAYQQAIIYRPDDAHSNGALAGLHRRLGNNDAFEQHADQARQLMGDATYYDRACLEAICGNTDDAFELLKRAFHHHEVEPNWAYNDPDLFFLRDDPRFKKMMLGAK